ncbi:MAG: MFS transporter [Chloroflexi bacterium]|nr:MFS transporter [Chloroflexota bacterium]
MLVGAAVFSFIAALASLHDNLTFTSAIQDWFVKSDPFYRTNSFLLISLISEKSLLFGLISGLVIAPVVGLLLDRYGPRLIMLASVLASGISLLLITQVQNELQMHAALWIIGIGFLSITSVVVIGTLGKWFVRKRVLAFAIVSACSAFAGVFSLDTIDVIRSYGWQTTAIVAGVTVLVVGIPVALIMRRQPEDHALLPDGAMMHGDDRRRPRRKLSATARSAVRIPAFWQLTLAVGLVLIAVTAQPIETENYIGLYLGRLLGIFRFSYLAVCLATVGIVAIGFISFRISNRVLILASFASLTVAYAGLIVIYLIDGFSFELPIYFVVVVVRSIAHTAILFLQFAILADFLGRRNFGVVVGTAIAVHTVVSKFSSLLTFYVYEIVGHDVARFGLGLTALIIAAFLVFTIEPQSRVAARIRLLNRA